MNLQTKLEEMRKRCEAATPGSWAIERYDADNGYIHFSVNDQEMQQVAFCHEDMHPKTYRADAAFIASARQDMPALISALEVCLGALEEFRLGHVHAADLPHTRSYGDNYGWCDYCQTKVSWGPGEAEIALASAEKIIGGGV